MPGLPSGGAPLPAPTGRQRPICDDQCVHNSRPVLLTAAASGSVAIVGALFGADQFAAQAGVLALGSLGVLVAARHDDARRVRWSMLAGIAVLAVAVAVPDILTPPVTGPQRLVPAAPGTDTFVQDVVGGEWLTTLAVLLASALFLWAVTTTAGANPEPMGPLSAVADSTAGEPEPVSAVALDSLVADSVGTLPVSEVADPGVADPGVADPGVADPGVTEPLVAAPPTQQRANPAIVAAAAGSLLIVVTLADLGMVAAGQKRGGVAAELIITVGFPLAVALFAVASAVFGAYRVSSGTVTPSEAVAGSGTVAPSEAPVASGMVAGSEAVAESGTVAPTEMVAGSETVAESGMVAGSEAVAGSGTVAGSRMVTASGMTAAGGLLLTVSALAVVYMGVLSAPLPYGYRGNLIFDAAVVRTGWGDLDPLAALRLAGMLAGAGCLVLGQARRRA
jgi:hypothetical protein